jgi:hypothetical protein
VSSGRLGAAALVAGDGDPIDRAVLWVRRVVGLATAAMLGLSWPLWVEHGSFPRVPFVVVVPALGGPASWVCFGALIASVLFAVLPTAWRGWLCLSLALLIALILQDQHRFQPWAYQYGMTGLFLAGLPRDEGLRLSRWWFISIYFHSGLSKLDLSFTEELGSVFLATLLGPLGIDPGPWPVSWRAAAALAMPLGELAVALALLDPGTRRLGRIGALAMHGLLLGVLGPFGLRHGVIVLVWNVAMAVEVWIAFGPEMTSGAKTNRRGWVSRAVGLIFWAGVLLPFGERFGVCDAWPSHALYSSHIERLRVSIHESEQERFPPEVWRHLRPEGEGDGPWHMLDLTGWSREVRGTPVYPQNRACLGLAEALTARYGGRGLVRVVVYGPAGVWTRYRRREEAIGLDAIRTFGSRYRLNAHPAGAGSPAPMRHDTQPRAPIVRERVRISLGGRGSCRA